MIANQRVGVYFFQRSSRVRLLVATLFFSINKNFKVYETLTLTVVSNDGLF